MEVTAAERTTIYTNISPLAQRVNNYIQTQHSWSTMSFSSTSTP